MNECACRRSPPPARAWEPSPAPACRLRARCGAGWRPARPTEDTCTPTSSYGLRSSHTRTLPPRATNLFLSPATARSAWMDDAIFVHFKIVSLRIWGQHACSAGEVERRAGGGWGWERNHTHVINTRFDWGKKKKKKKKKKKIRKEVARRHVM